MQSDSPSLSPGSLSIGCAHNQARTPVELWLAPLSLRGWSALPAAGFTELVDKLYAPLCYSHTSLSPPRNWHGPAERPTTRN